MILSSFIKPCKNKGYDGIICGHIHKAEIRDIDEIEYLNCGDWVESCTAIVETFEGEFKNNKLVRKMITMQKEPTNKLALALGGGAARGAFHLGVLDFVKNIK